MISIKRFYISCLCPESKVYHINELSFGIPFERDFERERNTTDGSVFSERFVQSLPVTLQQIIVLEMQKEFFVSGVCLKFS